MKNFRRRKTENAPKQVCVLEELVCPSCYEQLQNHLDQLHQEYADLLSDAIVMYVRSGRVEDFAGSRVMQGMLRSAIVIINQSNNK